MPSAKARDDVGVVVVVVQLQQRRPLRCPEEAKTYVVVVVVADADEQCGGQR